MSDTLPPAAMAAAASAARLRSGVAPRAVSHFGLAAMEARAARVREAVKPLERLQSRSMSLGPFPQVPPEESPKTQAARPAVRPRRVVLRLWLPLTALFLILAPFAFLLTPLLYLSPKPYRTRPLATVLGVGRLLLSLGGTVVHVDTPEALVSLRIF